MCVAVIEIGKRREVRRKTQEDGLACCAGRVYATSFRLASTRFRLDDIWGSGGFKAEGQQGREVRSVFCDLCVNQLNNVELASAIAIPALYNGQLQRSSTQKDCCRALQASFYPTASELLFQRAPSPTPLRVQRLQSSTIPMPALLVDKLKLALLLATLSFLLSSLYWCTTDPLPIHPYLDPSNRQGLHFKIGGAAAQAKVEAACRTEVYALAKCQQTRAGGGDCTSERAAIHTCAKGDLRKGLAEGRGG